MLLPCVVLISLLLRCTESYLTVRVEINPDTTSKLPPPCSATFVNDFESSLTAMVLNATQQLPSLSDFIIPSGLHLTYFNNDTTWRGIRRRLVLPPKRNLDVCTKCYSNGCTLGCGIGVCKLCKDNRRELQQQSIIQGDNILQGSRQLVADWNQVGLAVTRHITPLVRNYLIKRSWVSNGCLGDPNNLTVNVTYLSNVLLNAAMESALIAAFGNPSSPAAASSSVSLPSSSSSRACCSQSFDSCVPYCGTTQQQCSTCGDTSVVWLPQGPPLPSANQTNKCIPRWGTCTSNVNGCCPGLSCVGNRFWRGCLYIPGGGLAPTPAPTTTTTGCCTQSFASCVDYCGSSQQECQTCGDTSAVWLPNGLPSNANTCIPRWASCTNNVNGCCNGLKCIGLLWWKGCQYVP